MKITFTPVYKEAEMFAPPPQKASDFLPEWYKSMPQHEPEHNGNKLSKFVPGTSRTLRGCNPFLDTLTGGYIFQAPCDVEFSMIDGQLVPRWLTEYSPVEYQSPYQAAGIPAISDYTDMVFKWVAGWMINTPKGYSTLFTHPFNRHDLPFRTFSGIVETDTYNVQTDFPFQILPQNGEPNILIKKGTPICQAIPFKRDSWNSEIKKYDKEQMAKNTFNLFSSIDRSYRNNFWIRKLFN